jgi:hypothetical protein
MIIMKKVLFFTLAIGLFMVSCQKEPLVVVDDPTITESTTLLSGTFISGAHPTSGGVKVVEDKDKNRFLVFDNLKSDAGPDLRIYLSTNKSATNFTEITSDVKNGTYQLALPTSVDIATQKYVLIWCKQFSVLFGSAELK